MGCIAVLFMSRTGRPLSGTNLLHVGQICGRLKILGIRRETRLTRKKGFYVADCLCECGVAVMGKRVSLIASGNTRSCGCLKIERHPYKHREAANRTKEYMTWSAIKQRCYNPKSAAYDRYGGRDIAMSDRWIYSYVNFLHDVGRAPSPYHSIERIDNNGNYEPGNVRWATHREQQRNKSTNKFITFREETMIIADWAAKIGIDASLLARRLSRGWSIEKALTQPLATRKSRNMYKEV